MTRENLIKTRRGTAAEWASANPTLAEGETGFETDTLKFKIGDGTTAWNSLRYLSFDGGNLDEQIITGNTFGSITLSDFFDTNQPMVKYQGVTGTTITVPAGYNYAIYVDSQGNVTNESVTTGQTLTFKSDIILGTGTGQVWACQSSGCAKIMGAINPIPGGYPSEGACQADCCQEGNGLFKPRSQSCNENCRSLKEICESPFCSEAAGGNPGETRVFCNGVCCQLGQVCLNGNCCNQNLTCGNNCCSPVEDCCNGVCCNGTCCNGVCCPPGQTCCNGVCCNGFCCNGVCCSEYCCNLVCCGENESCVDGQCTSSSSSSSSDSSSSADSSSSGDGSSSTDYYPQMFKNPTNIFSW